MKGGDMKQLGVLGIAICLLVMLVCPAYPFDDRGTKKRIKREWAREEFTATNLSIPEEYRASHLTISAQVDTYTIAAYNFEAMNWQGWTRVDNTGPVYKCFWHVDDFIGLNGWSPLEGTQSMWCGARPDEGDSYMCSWVSTPGYGDNWDQSFISDPFDTDFGHFSLSFQGLIDTEPINDWISVEYDRGGG